MSYERHLSGGASIDAMLEGKSGGFSPSKEKVPDDVMAERLFGAGEDVDPGDEPEPEPADVSGQAPEPVVEAADDEDLDVLREAGWDESELKNITRDAAQRHALREMRRGKSERTAAPSVAPEPDDLETTLAEELGKGTAKKVAPHLRAQQERIAALERSLVSQRVNAVVAEHSGTYPELQRPNVRDAVLALAVKLQRPGDSDSKMAERALREMYGARSRAQTPADRAEARAQVDSQVSGGPRTSKTNKPTKDEAAYAAFRAREKGASVEAAIDVRKRLGH